MIFDQHPPAVSQPARAIRFEIGTKLGAQCVRSPRARSFTHAIGSSPRDSSSGTSSRTEFTKRSKSWLVIGSALNFFLQLATGPMQRYRYRYRRYSQCFGDLRIRQPFKESEGKDFHGALRKFRQLLPENLPQVALVGREPPKAAADPNPLPHSSAWRGPGRGRHAPQPGASNFREARWLPRTHPGGLPAEIPFGARLRRPTRCR